MFNESKKIKRIEKLLEQLSIAFHLGYVIDTSLDKMSIAYPWRYFNWRFVQNVN